MFRIVLFLGLIAAVAMGAAWIAEQNGDIALSIGAWRIDTSLPVSSYTTTRGWGSGR